MPNLNQNIVEVKYLKKPKKKKPSDKTKFKKALISLLVKILVIACTVFVLLTYVGGIFVVHDNDNFPSLKDGDLVVTYRLDGYYSGDVVVYEVEGKTYFGRVVGIPNDVVDFTESGYTVNGVIPYETVYYKTEARESGVIYPYTVKQGEVFVLADYREEGMDSRVFGAVSNLKGKVVLQFRRRGF